jgi:hypothetical protein
MADQERATPRRFEIDRFFEFASSRWMRWAPEPPVVITRMDVDTRSRRRDLFLRFLQLVVAFDLTTSAREASALREVSFDRASNALAFVAARQRACRAFELHRKAIRRRERTRERRKHQCYERRIEQGDR